MRKWTKVNIQPQAARFFSKRWIEFTFRYKLNLDLF